MTQFPQLSKREWEVLKHLQQGKSNKLIASSLDISNRTVEFHLTNIYAKFQVSSRIELILKLGNTTGKVESEKPGYSTVANVEKNAENRDKFKSLMDWAIYFINSISIIGKESEMKIRNLSNIQFILSIGSVLMIAALFLPVVSVSDLDGKNILQVTGFDSALVATNGIIGITALFIMSIYKGKSKQSLLLWLGIFSGAIGALLAYSLYMFYSNYPGPSVEAFLGFSLPIGLLGAMLMVIGSFTNLSITKKRQGVIA